MSGPNPRKRPAPGTTPMAPIPPLQQPFPAGQPDRLFGWTGSPDGTGFVDATSPSVNSFTMMSSPGQYGAVAAPSTALARRQPNRALIHSAGRPQFDTNPENWTTFPEDSSSFLPSPNGTMDGTETIEQLEERAARAKREAQAKRKQIPPFVQKLSSFLEASKNTDLIRWSEKGDSFIVLDEDEFAKTMIPELFKHNNYASFVRQLNMYGFHKRVGLSDNSMKASERKNKSPSEYYNPYFRRGHPNLLWLINKPKTPSNKKKNLKKDEGEGDSDEDGVAEEVYTAPNAGAAQIGRGAANAAIEVGPLQKKDLVQVKDKIERLQQQQMAISSMLTKLRQEHAALYQQAVLFQNMHERHENSINAILNFLANVFRKSLEEQGGTQSVQDLLSSILPNAQAHGQAQMPQQGSVIDLNDYQQPQGVVTTMGTPKRQQRLLPPIPHHQISKASTISPTSTASPTPQPPYQGPQMGSVTELFDTSPADTTSPAYIKDELRTNPHEGMMKIINDTNAVNTSGIDLSNVAAKTHATMSHDQRSKMLDIMAGQSANSRPPMNGSPTPSPAPSMAATPGSGLANLAGSGLSLSPVLSSIPPPNLSDFQATQAELDALQHLSHEQANGISQLSNILGPLSPSGRIPGLDDQGNPNTNYFPDIDYDQFIDSNAFGDQNFGVGGGFGNVGGVGGNTDGNDFNFTLDGGHADIGSGGYVPVTAAAGMPAMHVGADTSRIFETSSADTPSEAGTEEIPRNDLESPEREPKRRRKA